MTVTKKSDKVKEVIKAVSDIKDVSSNSNKAPNESDNNNHDSKSKLTGFSLFKETFTCENPENIDAEAEAAWKLVHEHTKRTFNDKARALNALGEVAEREVHGEADSLIHAHEPRHPHYPAFYLFRAEYLNQYSDKTELDAKEAWKNLRSDLKTMFSDNAHNLKTLGESAKKELLEVQRSSQEEFSQSQQEIHIHQAKHKLTGYELFRMEFVSSDSDPEKKEHECSEAWRKILPEATKKIFNETSHTLKALAEKCFIDIEISNNNKTNTTTKEYFNEKMDTSLETTEKIAAVSIETPEKIVPMID